MPPIEVSQTAGAWNVTKALSTARLKPDFSDFIIHQGHAYGVAGASLTCINLKSGKRVWKGGRYRHGQLPLLTDQDWLLLLRETGELAFVAATSDSHPVLATSASTESKTWNHPVLVGDLLLLRNEQEMAGLRLPLKSN